MLTFIEKFLFFYFFQNPRYRADNITNFELDQPERTTADYEGPAISQRVKAALDAALIGEDEGEKKREKLFFFF